MLRLPPPPLLLQSLRQSAVKFHALQDRPAAAFVGHVSAQGWATTLFEVMMSCCETVIRDDSILGLRTYCHSLPPADLGGRQKNGRNVWSEVNDAVRARTHDHDPVRQYLYVLLKL
jgi:hypothetical protein